MVEFERRGTKAINTMLGDLVVLQREKRAMLTPHMGANRIFQLFGETEQFEEVRDMGQRRLLEETDKFKAQKEVSGSLHEAIAIEILRGRNPHGETVLSPEQSAMFVQFLVPGSTIIDNGMGLFSVELDGQPIPTPDSIGVSRKSEVQFIFECTLCRKRTYYIHKGRRLRDLVGAYQRLLGSATCSFVLPRGPHIPEVERYIRSAPRNRHLNLEPDPFGYGAFFDFYEETFGNSTQGR